MEKSSKIVNTERRRVNWRERHRSITRQWRSTETNDYDSIGLPIFPVVRLPSTLFSSPEVTARFTQGCSFC